MKAVEFVFDKLSIEPGNPAQYFLETQAGEHLLLNGLLGQSLQIKATQKIKCVACQRSLKKTYQNGYCFPCATSLARCDLCIVKPERCHFHLGTCREPEWGQSHCMQSHYVYLANTSGLKVGITREKNIPGRWLDQGASQALPILKTRSRYVSGLCEISLGKHVQDKTDWRKLLKGEADRCELKEEALRLLALAQADLEQIKIEQGETAWQLVENTEAVPFHYPVLSYPTKIIPLSIEKGVVEGTLLGLKGQYLIFDTGVLNARKWTGWGAELAY